MMNGLQSLTNWQNKVSFACRLARRFVESRTEIAVAYIRRRLSSLLFISSTTLRYASVLWQRD